MHCHICCLSVHGNGRTTVVKQDPNSLDWRYWIQSSYHYQNGVTFKQYRRTLVPIMGALVSIVSTLLFEGDPTLAVIGRLNLVAPIKGVRVLFDYGPTIAIY